MRRLAGLLALIALGAMVPLLVRIDGSTAIVFSFIGMPALGLALALYVLIRWREGAFRFGGPPSS
jgi:hypothetical protein